MLKKILILLAAVPAVVILITTLWYFYQYLRDPLDFIDRPSPAVDIASDSVFYDPLIPENREYHKLEFANANGERIACLLSLPDPIGDQAIPALIILGGLEIGVENLRQIPAPGRNAILIYQYPYHPRYWYYGSAIREIPVIRESVLRVPAQVLALRKWITTQAWSDSSRINIAGYSFGALFVPAILHLARERGQQIPHAVISYGGADLYHLLTHNMTNVGQPWRSLVSRLAAAAIRGIEPAFHAPYLQSDILLINGTRDTQIPDSSWRLLHRLVPDPKQIILLDEGHMDPRKTELTIKLVAQTKNWLLAQGAINP